MMKFKVSGLVADLMPNIRLMQASGHFMFNYHADNSGSLHTLRVAYSCMHLVFCLLQYGCTFGNLVMERADVNYLAANTITVLFFTHCITKFVYFALRSKLFYRTLGIWNQSNSHPLFAESNNRYHALALKKMRTLLICVVTTTVFSAAAWTGITFAGESTHNVKDPENENLTIVEEIPRLLIKSWYPWNAMSGMPYYLSLIFQVYYVLFSLMHANLADSLFCSWLIFACEQLQHLKEIMKPLMELSASLDTYVPKSADLFRANSATSQDNLIENDYNQKNDELNLKGVYNTRQEMGANFRSGALQTFGQGGGGVGPNGLTKKQELMVRSAIKYWVERHKHVVRLVTAIGDAYGVALLLHMLTSTVMLTLLAYQATKINGVNPYAASVIGYLVYSLAQVFHFCIFGNRLIEESSSVMEAAYSCHWYDGSEEAKTFVQIVCQQCQKAMTISGAKFFTISLDLFASVLGAVVTYFMVLVQLK
nr:odorant receptor co-receptor [Agasicles hygrophila]